MFRGCMTEYDTYDVSFSCITFETETEPLSFINIVGRYACLVLFSMVSLAVFGALGLVTGYTEAYLENTSNVVMIFLWPRLVEVLVASLSA